MAKLDLQSPFDKVIIEREVIPGVCFEYSLNFTDPAGVSGCIRTHVKPLGGSCVFLNDICFANGLRRGDKVGVVYQFYPYGKREDGNYHQVVNLQGKGLGSGLMDLVLRDPELSDARAVNVFTDNEYMKRLLIKKGFREIGESEGDFFKFFI